MKNGIINYSLDVLNLVIDQDIPFSIAIKNISYTKKLNDKAKGDVSALSGSTLRHYYVFDLLIKDKIPDLEVTLTRLAMLYLTNDLFVKRLNRDEFFNELENEFQEKGVAFAGEFFKNLSLKDLEILSSEDSKSIKGWSVRNNIPEWLVGMWFKQYGERIGGLIIRGLRKNDTYCAVNSYEISKEDFLKKYAGFEDTSFNNVVKLINKKDLHSNPAFKHHHAFPIQIGEEVVMEKLDIDPLLGLAIYGQKHNNMHLLMMAKESHLVNLSIISPESIDYYRYQKEKEIFDLKNVELIQSSASIKTCLSEPVQTLILLPDNSNYRQLSLDCDYFLRCKQDLIDGYLAKQNELLEDGASLVKAGGQLVYMVNTINKKETMTMVLSFLDKHKEFELESHKQFLPFDEYQTCLYYAIMRKNKND